MHLRVNTHTSAHTYIYTYLYAQREAHSDARYDVVSEMTMWYRKEGNERKRD